jgi:hypothetical protein
MSRVIEVDADLKPIAYAWPGGYPMYYLAREGWRDEETGILEESSYDRTTFVLCSKCAREARELDRILIDCDVNWEDTDLICEDCNELIESAYAE